jgi:hypothetical protein
MRQAATAEPSTDTVSDKSRPKNGVVSFTRMGGSSIAALDAATWVTAAGTDKGRPIFTRGYVTITKLVTPADPAGLGVWFAALEAGLARFGDSEPHALPDGAQPLVGLDLTTHAGHFMGAGHNRLLLFTHEGKAFVRAAGTWDPMPWHIQRLPDRGPRRPARVLGPGQRRRAEHAAPTRPANGWGRDARVI